MRTIKIAGFCLLGAITLIPALIVALVFSIKPTMVIPVIQQQLKQYNIEAQFSDELSWQFYPNLGLTVSDAVIKQTGDTATTPLAAIGNLNFSVRLAPLFSRNIEINGIHVSGVSVYLHTDKNGKTNWANIASTENSSQGAITSTKPASPPLQAPAQASSPSQGTAKQTSSAININVIALHITQFRVHNEQSGSDQSIEDLNLNIEGFNLSNTPFLTKGNVTIKTVDLPKLKFEWEGTVSLTENDFTANQYTVRAYVNNIPPATIHINNHTSWNTQFETSGDITIDPLSPKQLFDEFKIAMPTMQKASALSSASVKSNFSVNQQAILLDNTVIVIDDSKFTGSTKLLADNTQQGAITTHWQLNTLPLDDYLPPTLEGEALADNAVKEEVPLPLDLLQEFNINASLKAGNIQYKQQTLKDLYLAISNNKGKGTVLLTAAQAFGGTVKIQGDTRAEKTGLTLAIQGEIHELDTGLIAKQFADFSNIDGVSNSRFSATSHGATDKALIENIDAEISIDSQKMMVNPINIEKQFCNALWLLQGKTENPELTWAAFTPLTPIAINAHLQSGKIAIKSFSANIEKIGASAKGNFDTISGDFSIPLTLALADSSPSKCGTIDEKWQKLSIPVKCKGNISNLGARTCLPDKEIISSLIKAKVSKKVEQAEAKIEQKISEKKEILKDKTEEKLKKEAEKAIDKETTDKLEDAWKDILKKRKN